MAQKLVGVKSIVQVLADMAAIRAAENVAWTVGLFKNNVSVSRQTVTGDLVDATFTGYAAAAAIALTAPFVGDNGLYQLSGPLLNFISDPAWAGSETIYGVYVKIPGPSNLLAAFRFPTPFVVNQPNFRIPITCTVDELGRLFVEYTSQVPPAEATKTDLLGKTLMTDINGFGLNVDLDLFKTLVVPARAKVLADFAVADFTGYAQLNAAGPAMALKHALAGYYYQELVDAGAFLSGGSMTTPNDVFGLLVTDHTTHDLLWSWLFPTFIPVNQVLQAIRVFVGNDETLQPFMFLDPLSVGE